MRRHHPRPLVPVLILLCVAGMPARAGWEYHGSAGLNLGRTDNPAFEGGCNPNYTPGSPLCLFPKDDPRYDPIVCEPTISGDAVSGDYTGNVLLTGIMSGTWAGSMFDLVYTPGFYLYSVGDLNEISHAFLTRWSHETGPRGDVVLSEDFSYTPEQEVDPNALAEGRVLLNRTDRLTNDARVGYDYETTARTRLGTAYRYSIRSFGSERFTDSASHNVGLRFTGRFTTRASIGVGYDISAYEFDDGTNPAAFNTFGSGGVIDPARDPGAPPPRDPSPSPIPAPAPIPTPSPLPPTTLAASSSTAGLVTPLSTNVQTAFMGWGYDTTETEPLTRPRPGRPGRDRRRGVSLSLNGGMARLEAPDAEDGTVTSPYVDTSIAWHTLPLSATLGYLRGLTDGGGAFANAETQNIFGDFRLHVAREWTGILAGSYLVNEQIEFGTAGSLGDAKVRTISTRAGMEYDLNEHWILNGNLTWYHQEICGDPCAVAGRTGIPELSTFRLFTGFVWYTD